MHIKDARKISLNPQLLIYAVSQSTSEVKFDHRHLIAVAIWIANIQESIYVCTNQLSKL